MAIFYHDLYPVSAKITTNYGEQSNEIYRLFHADFLVGVPE